MGVLPNGHETGHFDSWEIKSESEAIKTCDKSFFEHNGSGIQTGIGWFFDAEDMVNGANRQISFTYKGNNYSGRINKESAESGRLRVFWDANMGASLQHLSSDGYNGVVTFKKIAPDMFEILEGKADHESIEEPVLQQFVKRIITESIIAFTAPK